MPDWKNIVRERLSTPRLQPLAKEEVILELASHLEDSECSGQREGLSHISEVPWRKLSRAVERAKSQEDLMNHRTRSLWLPALVTFFGASISLTRSQLLKLEPHIVWVGKIAFWFYWPWLATLPLVGAVGARLSQRAQGPTYSRLMAALSPALVMLIVMLLLLPWGLAIDGVHFLQVVSYGLGLLNWVALPAVALLLGALPFLVESPADGIHSGGRFAG